MASAGGWRRRVRFGGFPFHSAPAPYYRSGAEPIGDEGGKGKISRAACDEVQVLDAIDLPEKILAQTVVEADRCLGDTPVQNPGAGVTERSREVVELGHERDIARPEV